MKFKITEAEAREMARLEEESGCDISAGRDWGIHLDKVMELALHESRGSGKHLRSLDAVLGDSSVPIDLSIDVASIGD
jgi:hypothetical protein